MRRMLVIEYTAGDDVLGEDVEDLGNALSLELLIRYGSAITNLEVYVTEA
jgi:hypothetical protein